MHAREGPSTVMERTAASPETTRYKPSLDPYCTAHARPAAPREGGPGGGGFERQTLIRQFHPPIAKAAVAPPLRPHGPEEATDGDAARQRRRSATAQGSNPNPNPNPACSNGLP